MALDTVADFVTQARIFLQDNGSIPRYSDATIIAALNMAIYEARRIRPDICRAYLHAANGAPGSVPQYVEPDDPVFIDEMYRPTFVYYMVGSVQMIDEEDVSDTRAAAFLNKFTSQLLSVKA